MSFINNRSNKGGAIYAQGSTVTISGCGINFSSNTAISSGAAIYLKNSSMTIETKGGNIFFENNRMGETPNDIFLDENSKLYFSIDDNKSIALKNGFLSAQQGLETQIFKTGNGILELGGKNIVNGRFSSTDGTVKLLANASYVGKELYFKDSVFDMTDNTAANNMNVVNVATFTSLTDLRMDVNTHSDINRRSDRIIASSVTLSGKLYLNVAKGNYKDGIWFHLIDSSGNNISGKYSDENVESGDVWCTVDNKDPNSLKIFLRGVVPSTFSSIPGLTYNQKAVAEALDLGSASDMKEELLDVVNMIDKLPTDSIKKKALESMNGYFLANAIKSVTYGSYVTDDVLYAREKIEHLRIWGQTVGRNRAKEKYNDNSWGMVIGADKEIRENIIAGTYGVYEANNITQEQNRAETDNVGVGIYGGYMVDENWMVKTSVNAMYNSYETNRSIGLGRYLVGYDEDKISHANFKGFALGIDIQSSLRMHLTESVEIRPYMAIEQKSVIYGSFKENGNEKQGLDLSVKRGLYLKRAMRLGIGAHRNKDKILSGYIKCEGQILIDEKGNAIESALTGEPTKKFKSEGYAQNRFLMGIGIGGTVEISDNLKLFADGQFNMGKSYIDLYGNAGIRYSIFAKKKRSKKPKITSSDFQKLYRLLE
ncbi:MAG: autotransporter outer membrane beta-barrel domain-containing protein [Elusimicrobiota bacterium]|nr:autotransporter outer membrane beta-barrel domain-containing protein [Elusimicrobiota bacterium]